jgi:hypothetical protein
MDYNTTPNPKKQKMDKKGYNINNFIDIGKVAQDFIHVYFANVSKNNIQFLIDNKMIREYTTIKYNTDKMKGKQVIPFLNNFSRYSIKVNTFNYIDSGSRRIDISIIGTMTSQSENINFNQTFIICNQDESWYIKNSIFLTF